MQTVLEEHAKNKLWRQCKPHTAQQISLKGKMNHGQASEAKDFPTGSSSTGWNSYSQSYTTHVALCFRLHADGLGGEKLAYMSFLAN